MNTIDAATAVVADYPGGASSLAPRIPKGVSSLSHEVSETHGAKLGIRTAARITQLTGDKRIVLAFLEECGLTGILMPRLPIEVEGQGVEHVTHMMKELADVATAFGQMLADGKVTPNERDEFMRQAGELQAAVQRTCEYVEAQHAASQQPKEAR